MTWLKRKVCVLPPFPASYSLTLKLCAGVKVFIDPKAVMFLLGSKMDFVVSFLPAECHAVDAFLFFWAQHGPSLLACMCFLKPMQCLTPCALFFPPTQCALLFFSAAGGCGPRGIRLSESQREEGSCGCGESFNV